MEPQSQIESEISSQEDGEKRERIPKKLWHGKRQIYEKLQAQMEFYFSPSNLAKDRFMSKSIQEDPFIPLSTFMTFNKIKVLLNGGNENVLRKALSRSAVLELSEDQLKVRRKENAPVKSQDEIDECTIYVEQVPINSTNESLEKIFSKFGKVNYVSLPRYKKSRQIKQFGFVEFDDKESINQAINCFRKFDGVLQFASLKAENLLSIATHEKEEPKEGEDEDQGEEPPVKKARVEETVEEPEVVEKIEVDGELDGELDGKLDGEELEDEKDASESEVEESPTKTDEPTIDGEAPKKKKNRKHKKKSGQRTFLDERVMAMKIMRKKEWKKMRNSYLNLERQKAKEIKKILRESYNKRNNNKTQKLSPAVASPRINFYGSPNQASEEPTEPTYEPETNTSSGLVFVPGVIVNIKFREPCLDPKELKKEFKQFNYVNYVDILEGGAQCYVRVDASTSAQELVNQYSSCEYETEVLKDELEKEYWKKIFDKRDSKKNKESPAKKEKPVRRRRGREKLLEKINKASQHIRFEESEEIPE